MKFRIFAFSAFLLVLLSGSLYSFAEIHRESNGLFFGDAAPSDSVVETEAQLLPQLDEFYQYAEADTILRVAVVLSDIYSKKDMEFTRGFMLGLDQSQLPPYSVSLKIVNGEIPQDSLLFELNDFEPHVLVSTFEKDPPFSLLAYTNSHGNSLINVFDAKKSDFQNIERAFQLLVPSEVFNADIADYFFTNYSNHVLIMVGEPDLSDLLIRELAIRWPEENLMIFNKENLSGLQLDESLNYIILPVSATQADVKNILKEVGGLKERSPFADITILGRPNWIAFSDIESLTGNWELFIPAKCYFDFTSDAGKRFITNYNSTFGHSPIKSFPAYAVMGYDSARYFIPYLLAELKGDAAEWLPENEIQSYFNLEKAPESGYFNRGSMLLRYRPWGSLMKVLIN